MGIVYEARDPNLDRRVAIKTVKIDGLSKESELEYEMRFRTEARSAGRLQHPNIVSVYDADRDDTTPFLVMEYVTGLDLKHHLDHGTRYTLEQSVHMMRDLLSALQYAHERKIIHRDIKPANLLIEPSGRVKLTDFGVARIQDSGEATRTQGSMVGTLKYMSPEQAQGQPVDASSDIFSAGIVLYQLLTDRRPFDGESYLEILTQITQADPPAPSTINDKLPVALDAVVARALAKSKAIRFATAAEFSAALIEAAQRASDLTITPSANPLKPISLANHGERTGGTGTSATVSNTGASGSTGSAITQELELVYWKDVKDSADIEDLEGFLGKFPNAIYADLAKRRLKKLYELNAAEGIASNFESTQIAGKAAIPVFSANPLLDLTTVPVGQKDDTVPTLNQARATTAATPPMAASVSEDPDRTVLFKSNNPQAAVPVMPSAPSPSATAASLSSKSDLSHPKGAANTALPVKNRKTAFISLGIVAIVGLLGVFYVQIQPKPAPVVDAALPASSAAASTASLSSSQPVAASAAEPVTSVTATPSSASAPLSAPNLAVPASASITTTALGTTTPTASVPRNLTRTVKPSPGSSSAAGTEPFKPATGSIPETGSPVKPRDTTVRPPVRTTSGSASVPTATNPDAPVAKPADPSAAGPAEECGGRILFAFQSCMNRQCEKAEFKSHPACVERREMEERRRLQQNTR